MRTIMITILLAGGVAFAATAQDKSSTTVRTKPMGTMSAPVSTPIAPTTWGGRPADAAGRQTVAVALTSAECTKLGGEVNRGDDIAGQCASHAYCRVADEKGQVHRVCLSAQ